MPKPEAKPPRTATVGMVLKPRHAAWVAAEAEARNTSKSAVIQAAIDAAMAPEAPPPAAALATELAMARATIANQAAALADLARALAART